MKKGDSPTLSRAISLVENDHSLAEELLRNIQPDLQVPVIGITGSPGAGKSTLINCLIREFLKQDKRIAVLSIDPSSSFHTGALLGDRVRMVEATLNQGVFIRSMASRGALGGLSAKAFDVIDLFRSFNFDFIFVETVGVGQSEMDIVSLADCTLLVLVPEGGDDIQQLKSGVMEVGDVYIVNKMDRPGALTYAANLRKSFSYMNKKKTIFTTSANTGTGIVPLVNFLSEISLITHPEIEKLVKKALLLIQRKKMQEINQKVLQERIQKHLESGHFNLFELVQRYY